jgi:hypothetical protein
LRHRYPPIPLRHRRLKAPPPTPGLLPYPPAQVHSRWSPLPVPIRRGFSPAHPGCRRTSSVPLWCQISKPPHRFEGVANPLFDQTMYHHQLPVKINIFRKYLVKNSKFDFDQTHNIKWLWMRE